MTDRDLPPDLERVLRDQSIIVPQDQAVWELMAKGARQKLVLYCAECGEPFEDDDVVAVPRVEDGRMVHEECAG